MVGKVADVIVTLGYSPSAQRNAAVRASSGDILLFLDDDSEPSPGLVDLYRRTFQRAPALAAVGGPAETCARTRFERIAGLVLGEPLVMGRSASRYRAIGKPRAADERELILCNLAVRRSAFEAAGGFDENLYPNEENDLLERLNRRGEMLTYLPDALVIRPAPVRLLDLVQSIHGYGRGRAWQARRSLSAITLRRLAAVAIGLVTLLSAVALSVLSWWPLLVLGTLHALYIIALMVRLHARGGIAAAALGPTIALAIHGGYALGLLSGLLRMPRPRPGEVQLELHTIAGEETP